ncbi:MAG: hypothetical protein QM477_04840 [Planctomycetota bacterium]
MSFPRIPFLILFPAALALTACGEKEEMPTTQELVHAASLGDEDAMADLENLVREKAGKAKETVNESDAAMTALYSPNSQDLVDVAESGNAQASFLLGQRLMSEKDDSGKEWMQKAVDANYTEAVYFVGKCKFHGSRGFAIDVPAGLALLAKAAADGHAQAPFDIGVAYRYGIDVEQNSALALEWYEKAQAAGFSAAADEIRQLKAAE